MDAHIGREEGLIEQPPEGRPALCGIEQYTKPMVMHDGEQ